MVAEALELANRMFNNTLVTAQTGDAGRKVQTIYFTEAANLGKRPDGRDDEYYLAILLDRATSMPVIVASTEGGVEIEKVAHETPEKILTAAIDPLVGPQAYQGRELAYKLGLNAEQVKQFVKIFTGLGKMFADLDLAALKVIPYDGAGR